MPFDKEAFFQKQIEECRALEKSGAKYEGPRILAASCWTLGTTTSPRPSSTSKRPQQCVQTLNQDGAKA